MKRMSIKEKSLFAVALLFSGLFWAALAWVLIVSAERYLPVLGLERAGIAHVIGLLAAVVLLVYAARLLRVTRKMAFLRGHAVEVGPKQSPELHTRIGEVCERLQIEEPPVAYLLHHPCRNDTYHLRYRDQVYIVISGELIDAFTDRQGAVDFLVGQELARINDPLRRWKFVLLPAGVLPLIGAAYARAKVQRYDRIAIEACKTKVDAAFALAMAAAGLQRWKALNIPQFAAQGAETRKLRMAFFELVSPEPWLCKRMARLRAIATNSDTFIPRRQPLAYLPAALTPCVDMRALKGVRDFSFLLLWVALISFWGTFGYQQLVQQGYVTLLFPKLDTPSAIAQPEQPPAEATGEPLPPARDKYMHLHADLKTLGRLAHARHQKHGDIPCEIDHIEALQLNYRSSRYAFSCDEPIVYTLVERGEFEPGRAAHLHSYNWKTDTILKGPAQ